MIVTFFVVVVVVVGHLGVAGNFFAGGGLASPQSFVLHLIRPAKPEAPAATPHLVEHLVGGYCIHLSDKNMYDNQTVKRVEHGMPSTRHASTSQAAVPFHSYSPQAGVSGHFFANGFLASPQSDVVQVTFPGVPVAPSAIPHLLEHPLGEPCTHLPNT